MRLQNSKNTFYRITGSCNIWKRNVNIFCWNINIQFRKLDDDIAKFSKTYMTQNMFSSSLSIYICSFLLCLLHKSIFDNWETTWILWLTHSSIILTKVLSMIKILLSEFPMVMLYKNQFHYLIYKLYDDVVVSLRWS